MHPIITWWLSFGCMLVAVSVQVECTSAPPTGRTLIDTTGPGILSKLASTMEPLLMTGPNPTAHKHDKKTFKGKAALAHHDPSLPNPKFSGGPKHNRIPRWIMIIPAIPTCLIFIGMVIGIAVKNYYDDNHEASLSRKAKKRQKHMMMYDDMLSKYQEARSKKKLMPGHGRKSSQVQIEGIGGRDPASLAKKHMIMDRLQEQGAPLLMGGAFFTNVEDIIEEDEEES